MVVVVVVVVAAAAVVVYAMFGVRLMRSANSEKVRLLRDARGTNVRLGVSVGTAAIETQDGTVAAVRGRSVILTPPHGKQLSIGLGRIRWMEDTHHGHRGDW